ncbi:MAG: TolC family protein [Candidatus Eremiobacteraeota bacterium]|nr:TolC family protein [Candidatus Eremiobacteraeota bacterium]
MFRSVLITFVIAALLSASASAQPTAVLPKVPTIAPGYGAPLITAPTADIVGDTQQPFVGLTLSDAIAMALARNPDLAIAQANRQISGFQVVAAKGAYDLRFMVSPSFQHSVQAPTNAFFAGPNFGPLVQNTAGINAGAQGILPGGAQYNISANAQRIDNNSTINAFDPYYPSAISVSLTQPLLKNGAIDAPRRELQLAKLNADSTDAQTLVSASGTIANVENAYWDLVAAWRNVAIQEDALRQAIAQQQSNERLAKAGTNAPIEAVQSSTQVNIFQDDVYSALQNVARLQNQLKGLMLANQADPIWMANLVPTSPVLKLPPEPALADLVTQALRTRPEIQQIHDAAASAAVNVKYAKNQTLPQVDVQAGYTTNGFAGQPTDPANSPFNQSSAAQLMAIDQLITVVNRGLPPSQQIPILAPPGGQTPPGYLVGNLNQSLKNLFAEKFPAYQVGLTISFPFGNRTAKANYAIAQVQARSAAVQEIGLLQRVTIEARNALQTFRTAEYRLISARAGREASERVLASEQRRFRNGASTTFLVLQRQVQLQENRGRELQAQTDLNKAVVELQRVSGTILHDNNVNLTSVGKETLAP